MIESALRVTADSVDLLEYPGMQSSTHQSRDHGNESNPATTEAWSVEEIIDGYTDCTVGQANSPETDALSVHISAKLFGDYSYIYDEYLD